jgi:hypothetical protein
MGHQTRFSQSTTCSHPAMPINARRDKLSLSIHELLAMSNQKHGPTGPSSGSPSAPLKHTHRGRNRNKILIPDNYLSNRSSTQRQRNPPLQARVKRCFSLDTFCHAELHVDEIVVMVSEERRALMSRSNGRGIGVRDELREDVAGGAPSCIVEGRQILLHRAMRLEAGATARVRDFGWIPRRC